MPTPSTAPVRRPHRPARFARLLAVAVLAASAPTAASGATQAPQRLSDAEFWTLFTTHSEPGGSFASENFVSNEMSFQHVIPTLQRSLTREGVYLGVGPEQNFTYIANLQPRLAIIFDIRRQNAMQHLMYKALFEQSPTRADFIARLFSRPSLARLGVFTTVAALFDSAETAAASDSAYRANWDAIVKTLTDQHRFALSPEDLLSIEHVYRVFFEAGPAVNYGYRSGIGGAFRTSYPTYGMLQAATNVDTLAMAFLASEEHYRAVRDLQLRNLIVPVVGDFAGPKAIRGIGEYLTKRGLTVTAFYLSNVEQYLFRERDAAQRFYANVATLPIDSTSTFIRSIPRSGRGAGSFTFRSSVGVSGSGWSSITIMDSAGVRVMRTVQDSAGTPVVRLMQDSAGVWVTRRPDSTRTSLLARDSTLIASLRALGVTMDSTRQRLVPGSSVASPPPVALTMGGQLASGLASIRGTLDAMAAGRLSTYQDVMAMTQTTGWK